MSDRLILVIDDSVSTLEFMKFMIEDLGYKCIVFQNPTEAVHVIPHLLPDLIICDYMMFDMDGLQVITALRGLHVKCKMVLYSAMFDIDVPKKCEEDGIDFYVKPIHRAKLKEILDGVRN
jgi:CheY-like chemotaxis protein